MSGIISQIKQKTGDNRSDDALTLEWGIRVEQEGRPDIFEQHPDFRDEYYALKRQLRDGAGSTFGTGLKVGVLDKLPEMGFSLAQMGINAGNALTPDLGVESAVENKRKLSEVADWLGGQAKREQEEAAARTDPFGVRSFEEVQTPADLANFGSRVVGENIPQLALSFIPGAAAGKVAQAGALARGALAVDAAASGLKAAQSAAYLSSALQNTADIYGNLDDDTKRSGKGIGAAAGGGALAGLLDTVSELPIMSRLFPAAEKSVVPPVLLNVLRRGGVLGGVATALTQAGAEGVTETIQEAVAIGSEEYAQGREYSPDVIRSRLLNAGVGGALLGGTIGGVTGVVPGEKDAEVEAESFKPALATPIPVDQPVRPAPSPARRKPWWVDFPTPEMFAERPPDLSAEQATTMGRLSRAGNQVYEAQLEQELAAEEALNVARTILAPTELPGMQQPPALPGQEVSLPEAPLEPDNFEPRELEAQAAIRDGARTEAIGRAMLGENSVPSAGLYPRDVLEQDIRGDVSRFRSGAADLRRDLRFGDVARQVIASPTSTLPTELGIAGVPTQQEVADVARKVALRELPATSKRVAKVEFISEQEGAGNIPGFKVYRLLEAIGDLPEGTSVTEKTLNQKGYILPKKVRKAAPQIAKQEIKAPLVQAPMISTVKYVSGNKPLPVKNAPLNGLLFTDDDGDSAHRIAAAAGSSRAGAYDNAKRRSVLLLDKATGKIYNRLIQSKDAASKLPGKGIRIADGQRKLYSGEPGYKKGGRGIDFESGDESVSWEALAGQQFNGQPRFEVLGYLHWDKPQTSASFNFASIDEMQNNPVINRVLKRNFQPEANKAKLVEKEKKRQRGTSEGLLRTGGDVGNEVKGKENVVSLDKPASDGSVVGDVIADKGSSPAADADAGDLKSALYQLNELAKAKGKKIFEVNLLAEKIIREYRKVPESKVQAAVAALKGRLGTPAFDDYLASFTLRTGESYVYSVPQADVKFYNMIGALRESGVDVLVAQSKLIASITGNAKARGVTITKRDGKSIIALAVNYLLGTIRGDDIVRLYHEAAHPFLSKLPEWQQQAFQNAISNLPWYMQGWVTTGLGMDARLIANTPREELSAVQRVDYDRMTPEELNVLRGTDPTVLAVERAVEHLATVGVDTNLARDIISQIIRFVKGVMLRAGIELQKLLKGEKNTNPDLVRAFVENKWLQFINRDFANSPSAIAVGLKEFIGAPRTQNERLRVYDNINGTDQNFYYDPRTGAVEFVAPAEGTTESITDFIARVITDKNLGAAVAKITQQAGVPTEVLETMSNGIPFEDLTTEQQVKLVSEAQRQIEAVQLQRNKEGALIAPNKQPSKLTELQYRIVRTPFFKAWFGDWETDLKGSSKVLDPETFEPRVMYHGTMNDFDAFAVGRDMGFHFGTPQEAQDIIVNRQGIMRAGDTAGANMIPAFLNIKNPAPITDLAWVMDSEVNTLRENGIVTEAQYHAIESTNTRDEHVAALKDTLIENGYDGAVYQNLAEGDGTQLTFISFYPQQIKSAYSRTFTPSKKMMLTVRASESLDPTVEANTQFAAINHVSAVVANILNDPEVARTLPSRYTKNGQETVEQLVFGISPTNSTAARKAALIEEMQNAKSFVTNNAFPFSPGTKINELPVGSDGSSAQQKAMRTSLLSLQHMESAALHRIAKMMERKEEIEEVRKAKKRELTVAETNELDRINQDLPVFNRMLNQKDVGLHDQILRMQGKLQVGVLFDVVAGAEYVVPPSPTAQEDAVMASKARVPANLYFETPSRQAFTRDLAKMQEWLANDANRANGWLYETVATQFRKLSEVNLKPTYDGIVGRFKKTAFDAISNMLRGIGTPQAKFLSSRFYSMEKVIQQHTAEMEVMGGKWSSVYDSAKRAVNFTGHDPEFRDQYFNRLMQLLSATPDGTADPYNKVIDAFNDIRPAAYKIKDSAKPAFRELMRASIESERTLTKIFNELGLKVQDEDLGTDSAGRVRQRGLIRQGLITGRLSVSDSLDTIWEEMKPVWTNTMAPALTSEEVAASLWKENRERFAMLANAYFTPSVKKDFVEPLIYSNKQYFTSVQGANLGIRVMASQANVRQAWAAANEAAIGGDMMTFISELNRLEGGNQATEAEMAGKVMHSFKVMFAKVNGVANERAQAKISGIPVLPREMMNARTAEDFPPEWIDYALFDQGSNRVALHSMALNHAFGRDGLTSGEFAKNMAAVSTELDAIRREYTKLRKEVGLTDAQTKERMGADKYRIALDVQDHQYLLNNISEKMRYLVNPISTQLGDARLADELLGLSALGTLQNVRSALVNTTDVFGALYRQKFSTAGLKAVKDAITYTAADGASALLEMFGVHTHFMAEFARKNRDLGAKDPDNFLRWRDRMTDYGTGNVFAPGDDTQSWSTKTQNAGILIARRAKALINANPTEMIGELSNKAMKTDFIPSVPGDAALAPKLRLMGIFKSGAMWLTNGAVYGQYNAYKDLVMRGLEFINHSNDPQSYANRLVGGEMTLNPADLGYNRKFMVLNDRAAWDYMTDAISTKMNAGSVERMIGEAWLRTQADPNAPVITNEQFSAIRSLALSDVQLNSMTTNLPADWRSNPMLRSLGVFLTWPYMAMVRFPALFQNAQGKYTLEAAMDGMLTILIPIIPLTLAASMGVDWYDEYAMGKKQNLRDIGADALVPGLAPFAYPMATLERLARYGTGGLASEVVNATLNFDDARGGLSADSRVFLLSQLQNFRYTVGNLWQTEHIDYKGVMRPMIQFMGGNGILQYAQLANRLTGADNAESAINERISIANYLRAVGRDLDLQVIPSKSSGQGMPNKATPFISQMELAVYQDDIGAFKDAFADAVRTYREEHPDAIDPAKEVTRSFQSRHPLRRVFRVTPTDGQYKLILENLSDHGREAVDSGVRLFNKYLLKLGAKPFDGKNEGTSFERLQKRMQASSSSLLASQLTAAQAAYADSFID